MAIELSKIRKPAGVRIISKKDSAIDWKATTPAEWDRYMGGCLRNEDAVKFLEGMQPTIFLCNFDFDGEESAKIKNYMSGGADKFADSKKSTKVTIGSWGYMVVKYALKEIQNPPGTKDCLELKKDSKGYVNDETMNILARTEILDEIFAHYLVITQADKDRVEDNAKNS